MKKFFSLALVAVFGLSAMAANVAKVGSELRQEARYQKPQMQKELINKCRKDMPLQAQELGVKNMPADAATDTAMYFPSYNVLKGGWDFEGYGMVPMFMQFYDDTVTFYNNSLLYTDQDFGWALSSDESQIITLDTNLVIEPGILFDGPGYLLKAMPLLLFANGENYYYGNAMVDLYAKYGYEAPTYWLSEITDYHMPLTNCMPYTSELVGGTYVDNNLDPWHWTYENGGQYVFGSNLDLSEYAVLNQKGYTKQCDSLLLFYGQDGHAMDVDSLNLLFSSFNINYLPAGAGIKVDVFYTDAATHELATASYTATINDTVGIQIYTPEETGQPDLYWVHGQLNFPIHFTADGEVEVLITGFNSNNACLGFKADNDNYSNTTYHLINGKLCYYWIANVAMSFNTQFLEEAPEAISNETFVSKALKSMRNGQIVIEKGNKKFNLLGAEL